MSGTIVVVEDEAPIREMVADALSRAGFHCLEAAHAAQAYDVIELRLSDLILLDWMLPGISGIDFARRLKRSDRLRNIPIMMLTARGQESERVTGFDVGVDDYVVKPFSTRELVARVKAVLRRYQPTWEDSPLEAGGLRLDPVSHRLSFNGQKIKLGPAEFRLLRHVMGHPDRVFSRGQLLDQVWGTQVVVEERTVDEVFERGD